MMVAGGQSGASGGPGKTLFIQGVGHGPSSEKIRCMSTQRWRSARSGEKAVVDRPWQPLTLLTVMASNLPWGLAAKRPGTRTGETAAHLRSPCGEWLWDAEFLLWLLGVPIPLIIDLLLICRHWDGKRGGIPNPLDGSKRGRNRAAARTLFAC